MAGNRIEKLSTQLSDVSRSYSKLATQLSDRIAAIEAHLGNLPGKVAASITGKNGKILSYERVADRWGLTYQELNLFGLPPKWLSDCSVEEKAEAITLLVSLLSQLLTSMQARQEKVSDALETAQAVLREFGRTGKEGE